MGMVLCKRSKKLAYYAAQKKNKLDMEMVLIKRCSSTAATLLVLARLVARPCFCCCDACEQHVMFFQRKVALLNTFRLSDKSDWIYELPECDF
jgi:hypothetical protein